ncbi:transglycosylase SLT domain-containing protein [Agrobacterium vitis]
MTAKTDRTIAISITAVIVAALSSCTNVNDNSKADIAPKPASAHQAVAAAAQPGVTQPGASTVASANGTVATGASTMIAAANGTMTTVAPGTQAMTPPSQSAVTALANTASGNNALAAINGASGTGQTVNLATGQGPYPIQKPGLTQVASLGPTVSTVPSSANAPARISDNEPIGLENEALQPDVMAMHSAVPTPRPGSAASSSVAYASPAKPVVKSFALLDAQFDTSAPGPVPSATPEASKSTASGTSETASRGPTVINGLVNKYAALYGMPSALIHRVIHRESRYNPSAYSRGNYGLMQIRYNTARSLGYEGPAEGLFDPETNLKYAIKYLRGAWMVAENNNDNAVRLYARGYYFDAKRKGLLDEVQ